jgi:hypothetical protein
VATRSPRGLGDAVLEQHDRPAAIYDNGTATAELVQRFDVHGVDANGGDPAAELGSEGVEFGGITAADKKLAYTRFQEFGYNNASGCAVATHNPENSALAQ